MNRFVRLCSPHQLGDRRPTVTIAPSRTKSGCAACGRVALLILTILVFLAGRAFAETNADAPTGKPDAAIDLATKAGVDLVKGQWRYSDTKIIEVDFKAAGSDKQPTGAPIKTYDYDAPRGRRRFR